MFHESINAIIDAFEQQRRFAKMKISVSSSLFGQYPNTQHYQIGFLVGGFGTSGLLWSRLQSHFEGQGIKLSRPDYDMYVLPLCVTQFCHAC